MHSHAAVAAEFLGKDAVDVFMEDDSNHRVSAFRLLIEANDLPHLRRTLLTAVRPTLSKEEIFQANTIIALFNFYNTWIDLNLVDELSPNEYKATGKRLSTYGYLQPTGEQKK